MLEISPRVREVAERQLAGLASAKPAAEERPITTVRSKALHDLQFRAAVEGHVFVSDEKEHVGGHDAGPAPMRYFLAGIMMCHQVWCVKNAAVGGVQIDRLECEISGYAEHPGSGEALEAGRGFARIVYTVELDCQISPDEAWQLVDLAARRCPAVVTVQRGTRIDLTLVHNGARLGERSYGEALA
jgi:uncharacterized OsmC-like protein